MKHPVLALFLLFSLNTFAEEEVCELNDDDPFTKLTEDVSKLYPVRFADSCAVKNEISNMASWRESFDQKIESFLKAKAGDNSTYPEIYDDIASKSIDFNEDFNQQLDIARQKQIEAQKYNMYAEDPMWKDITRQRDQLRREKASKMSAELKEKLRSPAFADKLRTLAKNKRCVKDAHIKMEPIFGFFMDKTSKEGLEKRISQMENSKDTSVTKVCSGIDYARSETMKAPVVERLDISGDDFFANNEHELNEGQVSSIMDKIRAKLKSSRPNCNRVIKSVQIETSASLLANADHIGRWDFLKLSTKRAEFLAKTVKEELQLPPTVKINMNPHGENGNGTSGPCPYKLQKLKNGTYRVNRDPKVTSEELTKARYGSVSVEVKEEGPGCKEVEKQQIEPVHNYYATKCYDVFLECSDK